MGSELSPDREAILAQLVAGGSFQNRREALDHAVDLLREETETVAVLREALRSVERGEGVPLDEAVRSLRAKHGIPDAE